MTLGAARVIWSVNDLSMFVDEIVRGYVFMQIQAERGPISTPKIISSLEEYARVFGRKVAWTTDPLVVEMGLRQGARFILSRCAHYSDIHDPATLTALQSDVSINDRGDIPLPAEITADAGPYIFSQALSGRVTGTEVGPFTFGLGTSDAFKVTVGTGDPQTVTLTGAAQTAQEVVDQLNAGTDELTFSATNDDKIRMIANDVANGIVIEVVANDAYSVLGFTEGTYAAEAGTDSLLISVGGGADQPFTLAPVGTEEGSFVLTAAQVAIQLAALTGAAASTVNGALKLTTTTTGSAASIQVQAASTADTVLGFDNDLHEGSEASAQPTLKFTTADPGIWGDSVKIQITDSALNPADRFNVRVVYALQGELSEFYGDLSMDPTDARYVVNYINERSRLVVVEDLESPNPSPANRPAVDWAGASLTGGDNGGAMTDADWIGDSTAQIGIYSADKQWLSCMDMMIPGTTSVTVYQAMIAYCEERQDMIAYGQVPFGLEPEEVVDWRLGNAPWTHPAFNSHRFVLFYGFPQVYDDMDDTRKFISCLGHLASCLCKTDNDYGYHFAPVGPRRGTVTLVEDIDFNIQSFRSTGYADLFAENGINYLFISYYPGIEGAMFWEQRTTQRAASALRELNVVRFITMLYRALMPVLRMYLFEPNHPVTWRELYRVLRPAFQDWKDKYAIYDFALQCDQDAFFDGGELKNAVLNSGLDIDKGIYHCRALIQPTRTIYYLQFELGVMRTGESFENYLEMKTLPGWIRA